MNPVTDHLPISLRAYAFAPPAKPTQGGLDASDWSLTFDCETTTDASQRLRFGAYQLRKGEKLIEAGLFYELGGISASEAAHLRAFAKREKLMIRTREQFVDDMLYKRAYQLRARIIGFNLPFDISRLAIAHGPARGSMYGGFTFTLSGQKIWPHIRVKHISRRCAFINFAAPFRQRASRGQRNRGMDAPVYRGYFVDVNTLSASLLSQGFTLGRLSKFLNIPNPKLEFDDFEGPLTDAMLTYAVRDVQTTWECYAALIEKLDRLKLPHLHRDKIYSEASIGKGYVRAMGIKPSRILQPDFPPEMLGRIFASYYGGRSEIRIRRQNRQVILCDFLSMYPTVCTLMGLWRFVTASEMTWHDATQETRDLLAGVTLTDLQSPAFWPKLATLVQVLPDADIFPVRTAYDGDPQSTIGLNYMSSQTPLWFTLADCIASKLLTGKAPHIVEAVAFEAGAMQTGLSTIDVNGNPNYNVDPVKQDFFKRVIELRKATQARIADADNHEKKALEAEQHALKICANSTSYGIWMQINVNKKARKEKAKIYGHDGASFERLTGKVEEPGEYSHPLISSLITGAARLMLAITECQIEAQGLDWAFCDTDSMAIAKPDDMPADQFAEKVDAITEWFSALNPYDFGGSILKNESENRSLATNQPEPLYCWAVSSKRYALYNLDHNGKPIMRKVSAHGLGHLLPPYRADNAPIDTPAPPDSVLRDGVERWHCDLWYQIVVAGLGDKPDMPKLNFHPAMQYPAISRFGATAPELLRWFNGYNAGRKYPEQVKPFGFLLSLRANQHNFGGEIINPKPKRGRPPKAVAVKPVATFTTDLSQIASLAFDRESGKPVCADQLQTYANVIAQYHMHPESKFIGGDFGDAGTTRRRHVQVTAIRLIGKESDEWELQAALDLNLNEDLDYGLTVTDIDQHITQTTHKSGQSQVMQNSQQAAEIQKIRDAVDKFGLRQTARIMGVDPSNLRRKLAIKE